MKRIDLTLLLGIAVGLALLVTACGGGAEEAPPTEAPAEPEPTITEPEEVEPTEAEPVEAEPTEEVPEEAALVLVNASSTEVCGLYVSAGDQADWGPNQLGADIVIPPGENVTLAGVEPGLYDVRFETCDGSEAEAYGLEVTDSRLEYALDDTLLAGGEAPESVEFVLFNNTSAEVCSVSLVPADQADWGPNQLAEGATILPGEALSLSGIVPGVYNVRFETCDGDAIEDFGLDMTTAGLEYTLSE
jgi:hypothetical protein